MSLVAYASSDESDSESEMASESPRRFLSSLPAPRKDVPPAAQAEASGFPAAYARHSPAEQEQPSPGFYGVYGLGFPPGYGPPPPYGAPGYGGFSGLGYGPTPASFPPPGMNLPPPPGGHGMPLPPQGGHGGMPLPPQGGHGIPLPPPHNGPGMNLPPPHGGPGLNLPPPQGGSGLSLPPPQGAPNLNLPPPQGGPNMNMLPLPPHSSPGMNLPPPQAGSGQFLNTHSLTLPPPQNSSGLNLPPPHSGLGMALPPPPPQSGNGLSLPPPMTLLSPQVSGGLNMPPPIGNQGLSIPPPQPLLPPNAPGQGGNLPENENSKPKKRSEPVRISVPELHAGDSDSDEDEPSRKKSVSQGSREGFGLSSLLPQPKNAPGGDSKRQPLPYNFTKKASEAPSEPKLQKMTSASRSKLSANLEVSHTPSPSAIKAAAKNAALQVTKQITQEENEEDSDDEFRQSNFFSLSESSEIPPSPSEAFTYPLPPVDDKGPQEVEPIELQNDAANAPLEFKTSTGPAPGQQLPASSGDDYQYDQYLEYANSSGAPYYPQGYYGSGYYQEQVSSTQRDGTASDSFMDDEAFKRLQGKRNRGREEINFVEIKGDDQLSGNQQWLTKALTEEKNMKSFSKKKGEQPTGQQRRKHQITYLIHQAKERELELKNTWAENKMSRRQTQAKYGF
ncbi:proline-rich protein PRCC [Ranitomeya variabilis]|uniref:proline-rich protein PRCC n=1 Tax=Ranitomeya variabilis TaxID=490064 RepID=UPI004057ADFC